MVLNDNKKYHALSPFTNTIITDNFVD